MSESDEETWAPVPGYEELYEVSDQGQVRRKDHGILTPIEYSGGDAPCVSLYKDGSQVSRSIPRLVLLAHQGEPSSPTMRATRIDTQEGWTLANLSWQRPVTRQKLTDEQALSIWREAWGADNDPTTTHKDIAARYGVSRQTVSHIKHGRQWDHATPDTPPTE